MDEMTKKKLQATACRIRMGVIEGTYHAKSGHPGGSLSICDTLTYLYFAKMHVDPKNPEMADRDRLVLSKGHCAPAYILHWQSVDFSRKKNCNLCVISVHFCRGTRVFIFRA